MSDFPIPLMSISQSVVERLGWVLVHSLWQFALIALLVAVAVRVLRRNSASARYAVLGVAMLATALVPAATWMLQPDSLPARPLEPARELTIQTLEPSDRLEIDGRADTDTFYSSVPEVPESDVAVRIAETDSSGRPLPAGGPASSFSLENGLAWADRATQFLQPWLAWIVGGWSVGVVLCSSRPLLGWYTLRRLRRVGVSPVSDDVLASLGRVSVRLGLRQAVRIMHSTLAQVPVVVGYLRPVILLPVSLVTSVPASQLEAILAHELAHVRRHDFLVNLLQTLVETVFFYHPAVWWLSSRLRAERENCCDDLVVNALGNRSEYGRALLAIEELRGHRSVLAIGAADGSLLARVRRIVGFQSDRAGNSPWPALSLGVCGLVAVVAMSVFSWQSLAQPSDDAPQPKPDRYLGELPGGLQVEFVGLAPGSADSKVANVWWKPDGAKLGFAPKYRGARGVGDDPPFVNTVIRVHGTSDTSAVTATAAIGSTDNEKDELGNLYVAHYGHTDVPEGRMTRSFEVGVASEPLSPMRLLNLNGQRLPAPADSPADLVVEDISVEKVGRATWGLRIANGRTRIVDPAGPGDQTRESDRNVTQLTLQIPLSWRTVDLRISAIDQTGKSHDADTTVRLETNDKIATYARVAKLYDVPFNSVDHFEYQFRLFRHWVTFANVSVAAGKESDVKVTVESLPVSDAQPKEARATAEERVEDWGETTNGLRARVIPVLSSMSENAIDPGQQVAKFGQAEDVAFAVELENVGGKPIKLLDTRHGAGYGKSKGKANSNWYGQFLFSIDLFNGDGTRIERPEVEVVDLNTVLDGVQVATLEPGKTHRFLLRPAKWLSAMTQRIEPGSYRAAVRYHGLPTRVAARIKEYQPDGPALTAVAGDIVSPRVPFELRGKSFQPVDGNEGTNQPGEAAAKNDKPDADPTPELVWGEATGGLRAAISFAPSRAAHAHGEKPELKLHVQNVGDQPVTLASLLWLSDLPALVAGDQGAPIQLGSVWYTGRTLAARVTLKPRQTVVFDAGNVGLAATKERAKEFKHITNRKLVAPAGNYTMQLAGRFGNSFTLKDGKGKVLAPLEGDWIGELKTGATPFEITSETPDAIKRASDKDAKLGGIQPVPADDTPTGPRALLKPAFLLPGHSNMMCVGFDRDDTELVAVSAYHFATVRRCDVAERKLTSEINLASDQPLRPFRQGAFKLSGDRRRVIAATDEFVGIWDTSTGDLLKKLPFPARHGIYDCWIDKLDCTPDLSVIAGNWSMPGRLTQAYDAHVMIWDGASGQLLQTVIDKHATVLHSIDLSADGKLLATTNGAGAKVWETSTGKLLRSFPNDNKGRKHSDPEVSDQYTHHVWSVQLSPDGKQIAIGDILGVRLWDVHSGELRHQLDAPYRSSSGNVTLVFSKDGQLLARTGTSGKDQGRFVPIWSTQTGEKLFELHTGAHCGAFSDDNKRFAVGLSERQMALAVWQLSGGAVDAEPADQPGLPSSDDQATATIRYHHRGKKAEAFIDKWKPVWGDEQLGIRYGIALTSEQRKFRVGQRVPMAVFFRNVSDRPLQVDVRPDFYWDVPKVTGANGAEVELEKIALLGNVPHYREKLNPGEAFGAIYLSVGLGKNPRPGRQDWAPYWKTPAVGEYALTHTIALRVDGPKVSGDGTSGDWKSGHVTAGRLDFEIVDSSGLVPGIFGGVSQEMRSGPDGSISYGGGNNLCQMKLYDDDRLMIAFEDDNQISMDVTLPLVVGAGGKRRAVWSAEIKGDVYQATAIPFSTRGCVFRLEKRRDGKLIHGSQQFFAVRSRQANAEPKERAAPLYHPDWRVDQSGTGVVAGSYTGASQVMQIAADGTVSFSDQPHGICHLAVLDDDRLTATFRDVRGMPVEVTLPLVTTAAQHRASWSVEIDGQTLRATAIPYSDTVYVFLLEKLLDGKLIEGSQQFYAIDQKLRPATPDEKAQGAKTSRTVFTRQQLAQHELPHIIAELKKQAEILKGCIVTAETSS